MTFLIQDLIYRLSQKNLMPSKNYDNHIIERVFQKIIYIRFVIRSLQIIVVLSEHILYFLCITYYSF